MDQYLSASGYLAERGQTVLYRAAEGEPALHDEA